MTKNIPPTFENIVEMRRSGIVTERLLSDNARKMEGYLLLHVPLDFRFPLNDGFRFSWDDFEAKYLELIHYPSQQDIRVGEPIFQATTSEEQSPLPYSRSYTVVRFGMPINLSDYSATSKLRAHSKVADIASRFPESEKPQLDNALSELLDEGLTTLNYLIRSYRILFKETVIGTLDGLGSIPPILLYSIWDISQTNDLAFGVGCLKRSDLTMLDQGLFLIHPNVDYRIEAPDFESTGHVVGLASEAMKGNPHPFFTSSDLMRSAGLRLKEGNTNGAVIESSTAIETFVSTFVRLDLSQKGKSEEKIDNILQSGFKNLVRYHLAQRLQVTFDPQNPSNSIDRWYNSAYVLRNEIVHKGLIATDRQAQLAASLADDFVIFVREQMNKHPEEYGHIRSFFSQPSN